MAEEMRRPELRLECIAEPRPDGERQVSTTEERKPSPPVFLQASQDDRAHDGEADRGHGGQQQDAPPKITGALKAAIPIAQTNTTAIRVRTEKRRIVLFPFNAFRA